MNVIDKSSFMIYYAENIRVQKNPNVLWLFSFLLHQFLYFYVSGGIVALTAFFLFGYGKELRAGRKSLDACDRLWGFPVYKASIPADQLEEIWVRQSARGAHLQLISDACIITGRTSNSAAAVWLASRLRRFYGT